MFKDGTLVPLLKTAATPETPKDGLTDKEVEQLVKTGIKDSEVFIDGAGCDFTVTVVSEQFTDLSLVKKQQMVMATLAEALGSGKLHAISVNTYTPEEWQARSANTGLLQISV